MLFSEMRRRLFELYNHEEFAAAYDLLAEHGPNFTGERARIVYWQACLAGRLGQVERVEDLLDDALQSGYWYATRYLRDDADLNIMEGRPRYEKLVEALLARHADIQAQTYPELALLEPVRAELNSATPVLLGLHGNNSNIPDTRAQWQPAADMGWLVGIPQSSQIIAENAFVWDDWELARQEIETHYRMIQSRFSLRDNALVLGGFSMGGGLSVWLALSGILPVDGFISIGGYIHDLNKVINSYRGQSLKGVILVGDQDPVCYPQSQDLAARLDELGVACCMKVYPGMTHGYPPDLDVELRKALDFIQA